MKTTGIITMKWFTAMIRAGVMTKHQTDICIQEIKERRLKEKYKTK